MKNTTVNKIKRVAPSLVLLGVIAVLAGLSFLPAVRGASTTVPVTYGEVTPQAMEVLETCRSYAREHGFDTKLDGKIKARVCGIPYTQKVSGARSVNGNEFTDKTESVSAFVKAGILRECSHGVYSTARGVYKNSGFEYGAKEEMTEQTYEQAYGHPSVGLVRYDLDGTVTSAVCIDENTYKYTLETRDATEFTRNEVKTVLKADAFPEYTCVEFTLITDGVRAIKITSHETFRIQKFGGTTCDAEYTEVFYYD